MPDQAKKGDTARVHYTGRLEDGEIFDSSEGEEPMEFEIGAGDVIAGFDEGVVGMGVGDKRRIEIEAENAYGQRIEGLVGSVPRDGIQLTEEPYVGMELTLQFQDGNSIQALIIEVTEDSVTIDANHPLAGRKLIFDVELIELKQAA